MERRYIEFDTQGKTLKVHDKMPIKALKNGYGLQMQIKHKKYGWQAIENLYK